MGKEKAGQAHPGEPRLPAAVGVVVAIGLYAVLPSALQIGPRYVIPGLELLLFIPLVLANPRRMSRQNRFLRRLSIGLVLLIALSNTTALVQLIHSLVDGETTAGGQLLAAAGQVWLTNVLVFALAYWELDRGGPVTRFRVARPGLPTADFRFPQDEDHDAISEVAERSSAKSGWAPGFIDYLYVSITNSSAFSPTDTMPLTVRAKLLMAVESVSALMLSVLVVSFAVGLLQRWWHRADRFGGDVVQVVGHERAALAVQQPVVEAPDQVVTVIHHGEFCWRVDHSPLSPEKMWATSSVPRRRIPTPTRSLLPGPRRGSAAAGAASSA